MLGLKPYKYVLGVKLHTLQKMHCTLQPLFYCCLPPSGSNKPLAVYVYVYMWIRQVALPTATIQVNQIVSPTMHVTCTPALSSIGNPTQPNGLSLNYTIGNQCSGNLVSAGRIMSCCSSNLTNLWYRCLIYRNNSLLFGKSIKISIYSDACETMMTIFSSEEKMFRTLSRNLS